MSGVQGPSREIRRDDRIASPETLIIAHRYYPDDPALGIFESPLAVLIVIKYILELDRCSTGRATPAPNTT